MSIIQGSIHGPILFHVYSNDIPAFLLTYWDAQGIMAGKNLYELIVNENIELKKLSLWFCSIYMAVNTNKMKLIIFHSKGKIWHNIWQQWSVPALYSNPNLLAILDSIHFNHYDSSRSYKLLLSFLFYEHLKKISEGVAHPRMGRKGITFSGLLACTDWKLH